MNDWTAIMMAAGKGERMRSSKPKVLHSVAGVPMARHVLKAVRSIEPACVVVVVAPDQRAAVGDALGEGVELVEQPDPLGTGDALRVALASAPPDHACVVVVNGDVPLLRGGTVIALAQLHDERKSAVTVGAAIVPAELGKDLGRLKRGARGKLVAIVEAAADSEGADQRATGPVEANAGLYAFSLPWLRAAVSRLRPRASGEYQITDLVALAVADGQRVEAFAIDDPDEAIGVNTRVQLASAEDAMQRRLREHWMGQGVTMLSPATTYIDAEVELAPDVTLQPNTSLRGTTRVGAGASVGPNAVVDDCDVGERVTIGGSTLQGTTLEGDTSVGHYCTLRPGTYVEATALVGNHVEIKDSRIGRATHIGHFAYVGDALIGAGVNIGAGTVTCNYDGKTKHQTIIEDGAFIGSDSLLVAPVRIGANASTGAGAVVTHDVAPGTTVAGVPARLLKAGVRSGGARASTASLEPPA